MSIKEEKKQEEPKFTLPINDDHEHFDRKSSSESEFKPILPEKPKYHAPVPNWWKSDSDYEQLNEEESEKGLSIIERKSEDSEPDFFEKNKNIVMF